jgi:outer membrane murein-binding lipoprotein Lpp
MELMEKRARKAELQQKIDQLRAKEIGAKSSYETAKARAARAKLEYERDRIRLRRRNGSK